MARAAKQEYAPADLGIKAKPYFAAAFRAVKYAPADLGIKAKRSWISRRSATKYAPADLGIKAKLVAPEG